MAEETFIGITNIEENKKLSFNNNNIPAREILRKFGKSEDYAELHVHTTDDKLITSVENFTSFTLLLN